MTTLINTSTTTTQWSQELIDNTLTDQRRAELMQELSIIQNQPEHECHDIMTITGLMTTEQELIDHINRNISG